MFILKRGGGKYSPVPLLVFAPLFPGVARQWRMDGKLYTLTSILPDLHIILSLSLIHTPYSLSFSHTPYSHSFSQTNSLFFTHNLSLWYTHTQLFSFFLSFKFSFFLSFFFLFLSQSKFVDSDCNFFLLYILHSSLFSLVLSISSPFLVCELEGG